MSNIIRKTTELAMHIVSEYTFPGCVIIDATCGNGHDTVALASASPSRLYAFDIQKTAVESTKSLLLTAGYETQLADETISIICDSHENMRSYVELPADVIVFNLGYLPGSDKSKTTRKEATLDAVTASLDILAKDGILCITMYSGHPEGFEEKEMLLKMAESLDSGIYHSAFISFVNQKNSPPEILLITKKK